MNSPEPLSQPNSAPKVIALDPLAESLPFAPVLGKYNVQGPGDIFYGPTGAILPGETYTVSVFTLCQSEAVLIKAVAQERLTAAEFARLVQIIASIGHVTRRECHHCRECYIRSLTRKEKLRLYSTQPQLGQFLGLVIANGSEEGPVE